MTVDFAISTLVTAFSLGLGVGVFALFSKGRK